MKIRILYIILITFYCKGVFSQLIFSNNHIDLSGYLNLNDSSIVFNIKNKSDSIIVFNDKVINYNFSSNPFDKIYADYSIICTNRLDLLQPYGSILMNFKTLNPREEFCVKIYNIPFSNSLSLETYLTFGYVIVSQLDSDIVFYNRMLYGNLLTLFKSNRIKPYTYNLSIKVSDALEYCSMMFGLIGGDIRELEPLNEKQQTYKETRKYIKRYSRRHL
jgi:hypothetical protein